MAYANPFGRLADIAQEHCDDKVDKELRTLAIERIIKPIVEGQIKGFLKEHPSVLDGVDWYKPSGDKATTFTNSLSKRIVRDLTCEMSIARLAAAFLELRAEVLS